MSNKVTTLKKKSSTDTAGFDVALVPLLIGFAACFWFTAAAAGTSSANALGVLALGALAAIAFSRDPFAADRYSRIGVGFIALLAIYYIFQRPFALSPGGAMLEGGRLASLALLIWAARCALTKPSSRWLLLIAIGIAAFYVSWPLLIDTIQNGAPKERVAGSLGYWNATAIVSLTLVPLAAALARAPRRWFVLLSGVMISTAAANAAATASRGALASVIIALFILVIASSDRRRWIPVSLISGIGLLVGVLLLATNILPAVLSLVLVAIACALSFYLVSKNTGPVAKDTKVPRPRRLSVIGVVICIIAAVLIGVLMLRFAEQAVNIRTNNNDATRLVATDDSLRFDWWRESIELWKHGKIFGQGGQAFEAARAFKVTAIDPVEHPHSLVFQVLVEAGLLGILILTVSVLAMLRATLGAPRSPERAVASALAVMITIQAAIDWTWSLPQVMAIGALSIAILLPGRSLSDYPVAAPLANAKLKTALSTLLVFTLLSIFSLTPVIAGLLADQAAKSIDNGDLKVADSKAKQSMQLVPLYSTLQLRVIALEAQGQYQESKAALQDAQRVWWNLPDGLKFARQRFPEGSSEHSKIQKRLDEKAL